MIIKAIHTSVQTMKGCPIPLPTIKATGCINPTAQNAKTVPYLKSALLQGNTRKRSRHTYGRNILMNAKRQGTATSGKDSTQEESRPSKECLATARRIIARDIPD